MIGVTGLACFLPQCQAGPSPVGEMPGPAYLVDLAGNRVTLPTDFRGKVLVIHFFVCSCAACVIEMVTLESIHRSQGGKDAVFCSVNVGDSKVTVERYLRNARISYTILLDEESATQRLYRMPGVPATYVLGRDNVIRFTAFGPVNRTELVKDIHALL